MFSFLSCCFHFICVPILQMIGASATLTDPARGFRADQWARYCGRHQTAEMIETTARAKLLEKSVSNKWTHDSIPRSKTTSSMAQNGSIIQPQQTSHSGGNGLFIDKPLIQICCDIWNKSDCQCWRCFGWKGFLLIFELYWIMIGIEIYHNLSQFIIQPNMTADWLKA